MIKQEIKKDFFRYRNGIVVETLKKLYPEGTLIYGLTLPQLTEIASKYPKDNHLALSLWDELNSRESRLLSLFLFESSSLEKSVAKKMINSVRNVEEADLLAFKLLKRVPYAKDLLIEMKNNTELNNISKYCVTMLEKNLSLL